MGVKVIFLMSIVFGVLLPDVDVGSDILLMINTLMFNIGDTLELSGCQSCYKTKNEVYTKRDGSCGPCLINDLGSVCGGIRSFLEKFHSLQNDANQGCKDENWRVEAFEGDSLFGNLVSGKYNKSARKYKKTRDICGIDYTKLPETVNDEFDNSRRMLVTRRDCIHRPRINTQIEACVVYGQASYLFCHSLTRRRTILSDKFNRQLTRLLKNDERMRKANGSNHSEISNKLYKIKITKESVFGSCPLITDLDLEPGFRFEDGCGIYFQAHNPVVSDIFRTCHDDACMVHLNALHTRTNKIHDLESWYENIDYYLGARVGGRVCSMLRIYGWTIMIPILMNFAANVVVFYNDVTSNQAKWMEFIPLLLLVYPQWRVLKLLGSYLFVHGDETKLEQDKVAYERDVGTLEPYLEASIQVNPCLTIQ